MLKTITFTSCIILLTFLSSCGTHSRMVYFQNPDEDSTDVRILQFKPTFKPADFISVVITANDLESAIPFNYPNIVAARGGMQGYTQGIAAESGYLIDNNGMVNLPILGKIKFGGLSSSTSLR